MKHAYTAEQKAIIRAYKLADSRLARIRCRYFGDNAGRYRMVDKSPTYAQYKAAVQTYDAAVAALVAQAPQYLYE